MNNNFRLRNACVTVPVNLFEDWTDQKFNKYLQNLPYLQNKDFYYIFQREISTERGEHWQCYFEFNKQVYFKVLQHDFRFSHIGKRKETQAQAIKYCKKERTRISGPYEHGIPKKTRKTENKTKKQTLDEIINKIKRDEYSNFFEIETENEELYEVNKGLLKTVWNRHHPIAFWDAKPARVIWCFGEKGSGKTVWTEKFLREQNCQISEIVNIFPNSLTYNDQIKFNIHDENGKVLVINEVDRDFPKYNNLILFIDRRGMLEAKESKIANNFQLIVINSLYRPEEVFAYLGKRVAGQVLRRIFSPFFQCQVYEIRENKAQLATVLKEKKEMSNQEFQNWYQPLVRKIAEPDDSLIKED